MAIQSDIWIREQAHAHAMIEPFTEAQRRDGCISYGLSSYGYDARVADEFKIFTNVDSAIVGFVGAVVALLMARLSMRKPRRHD